MRRFWWVLLLLFATGPGSLAQVVHYSSLCDEDLSRLAPPQTISFGGQNVTLASGADLQLIDSLRNDLRAHSNAKVVLYMFVEAQKGIATLRFETRPSAAPSETVARETDIRPKTFRESLQAALQPSSQAERLRLRAEVLPEDMSADAGKTVLFFDTSFYGTMPGSFELDNGFVFGSASVGDAVDRVKELNSSKVNPSELTAFVGYPETDADVTAIFGDSKTAKSEIWKGRADSIRQLAQEHGFAMMGLREMQSVNTKGELLAHIADSKGIVWIVAHSNGCAIKLSNGKEIAISPSDITQLSLVHKPFVMVRVCDAADTGFAEAFLRAGARAVWVNKGIVTAAQVNQELAAFLGYLRSHNIADAIRLTNASAASYFRGATLYVENDNDKLAREAGSQ